jgi:hypothetical protein
VSGSDTVVSGIGTPLVEQSQHVDGSLVVPPGYGTGIAWIAGAGLLAAAR